MKKYFLFIIIIGLIISCRFLDEANQHKAKADISIEIESVSELGKDINDNQSTNSINKVTVVVYDIDYSYSTVNSNYISSNIPPSSNITDFENSWVDGIEEQLDGISSDNCSVEKRQNLTVSGNSASGELEIEPGVKYFLVGLFENNELEYAGYSNIKNFKVGDSQSFSISVSELTETISTPTTPSGSASGATGISYSYTTGGSSSNLGHNVEYRFDWDNGTYSGWSSSTGATNSWGTAGTYNVKAQARCATHTSVVSSWSNSNTVIITTAVEVINFPDPNFEALIRETLNKPSGEITDINLLDIAEIDGRNRNITNITGIEYCENLDKLDLHNDFDGTSMNDNNIIDFNHLANLEKIHYLDLSFSNISDVSQFSELTNLDTLLLAYNLISDISPLSKLVNLEVLYLYENQISDISYIFNFNKLQTLVLQLNPISDISVLSNLSNLIWLGLNECQIGDISSLSNLNELQGVWLSDNQINDIYPLVENQDIGYGDEIQLYNNPLNNVSIYEYIPQLEARGVNVEYDEPETVTDIDGNVYRTVQIGSQVWMGENLKVTRYRNGDMIPNVTSDSEWINQSTGAYCYYNNNNDPYGLLYNSYAVVDSRGLAPNGWHVPSDDEWKELEMYLGMSQSQADGEDYYRGHNENIGGKLKETGTSHWYSPNFGATNETGFSAVPGGRRDGDFEKMGIVADFWTATWTSTDIISYHAWFRRLSYTPSHVLRTHINRYIGVSIRCVKN